MNRFMAYPYCCGGRLLRARDVPRSGFVSSVPWQALIVLSAALSFTCVCSANTNDLAASLQKGLFEEEANHNYLAAIQAYQEVIDRFDQERKLGATAIFRLAEVYRKQGKTNEANALSQRIVREFADQSPLAGLSQGYLAAAGTAGPNEIPKEDAAFARRASEADEINRLRAMIKDSPDLINARDQHGRTPLHEAAVKGQLLVAQFLVENGADIDAKETESSHGTALQLAALEGNKDMVELLLQKGANVAAVNKDGMTALHLAAGNGFRSIVESLAGHKADANAVSNKGVTPLHLAVANGFKVTAEYQLENGADPNLDCSDVYIGPGPHGSGTALDIAVLRADQGMLDLLLAHHADPNLGSRARNQETPLHIAAQSGNEKAAAALLAAGAKADVVRNDDQTPLDLSAANAHLPVAALLVSHGADVNRRNSSNPFTGWTPLLWAVTSGNKAVVQFLLQKGADVNAQLENDVGGRHWPKGSTPLFLATGSNLPDVVEILLAHKADPNLPNEHGTTPISIAIKNADPATRKRIVAALLDNGADVNTRDGDTKTLLMTAAEFKDKATLEVVLAHKPDVNATTKPWGNSALHFLVFSLNYAGSKDDVLPIAEDLIDAGANVNLRSKDGKTPLKFINVPFRPPPLGGHDTNSIEGRLASLLREHGALDDLPDFSRICVTRKGLASPIPVAERDTNGVNRFSVLEVLGEYYRRAPGRGSLPRGYFTPGSIPELSFPDPAGIRIVRPSRDMSGKKREIPLSLLNSTNTFDCAKDQWLEFGDVIEIPEREHPLSESPVGLTPDQSNGLMDCLQRKVKFVIRGQQSEVSLSGFICVQDTYLSQAMQKQSVQNLLRSTSDLSRVKVRRTATGNSKEQEFTLDVASFWRGEKPVTDDLWLRDGDIIEVQDKLQQAEK
jgi:ankyrin repeat protein